MSPELAGITGPGTAFLAGLVTSLHCAGMCGPLMLGLGLHAPELAEAGTTRRSLGIIARLGGYQLGRALVYALVGFAAGWLGAGAIGWRVGAPGARHATYMPHGQRGGKRADTPCMRGREDAPGTARDPCRLRSGPDDRTLAASLSAMPRTFGTIR